MVDVRDIGEIAAIELLKREQSRTPPPFERFNLVGPDVLTGSVIARIWSEVARCLFSLSSPGPPVRRRIRGKIAARRVADPTYVSKKYAAKAR